MILFISILYWLLFNTYTRARIIFTVTTWKYVISIKLYEKILFVFSHSFLMRIVAEYTSQLIRGSWNIRVFIICNNKIFLEIAFAIFYFISRWSHYHAVCFLRNHACAMTWRASNVSAHNDSRAKSIRRDAAMLQVPSICQMYTVIRNSRNGNHTRALHLQ